MKIVNLIENTAGETGCSAAHGLSFYIETERHKILMDLGPSAETLGNAEKLGIDLKQVDTVVLSHGHYDHAGGILPFAEINPNARIYMQQSAAGEYYSLDGDGTEPRYVGIEKAVAELPQIVFADGDYRIDGELQLFTVENRHYPIPAANADLKQKQGDAYVRDDFSHEQSLVIRENGKIILLSGCAHNGILNILEEFRRKFGTDPDAAISGFHLMKKSGYTDEEIGEIIDIAKALQQYGTQFYTGHCTGVPAYRVIKSIMGDQIDYVHSGDTVHLRYRNKKPINRRKQSYMKAHRFFAWATVGCFVLTMITGYKRK